MDIFFVHLWYDKVQPHSVTFELFDEDGHFKKKSLFLDRYSGGGFRCVSSFACLLPDKSFIFQDQTRYASTQEFILLSKAKRR